MKRAILILLLLLLTLSACMTISVRGKVLEQFITGAWGDNVYTVSIELDGHEMFPTQEIVVTQGVYYAVESKYMQWCTFSTAILNEDIFCNVSCE